MDNPNRYSLSIKLNKEVKASFKLSLAHKGRLKHSIDFIIKEGTPIFASADGVVVDVKDDSNEGGPDEKYATDIKYLNFMTLKHVNSEYSQYGHIAHKASLIKVGDKVKRGEPIANGIGMIGSTTTPHIHLLVCIDSNNEAGF